MRKQQIELRKELAESIISFRTWKNRKDQSICAVLFGNRVQVHTLALDGDEEFVLEDMKEKFWSIKDYMSN